MYQLFRTDFFRYWRLVRAFVMSCLLALVVVLPVSGPALANDPTRLSITGVGGTRHIQLSVNKSIIVDLAKNVSEVIVSNPQIAGAIMRNQRRAIFGWRNQCVVSR